jgi:hypothetical protein
MFHIRGVPTIFSKSMHIFIICFHFTLLYSPSNKPVFARCGFVYIGIATYIAEEVTTDKDLKNNFVVGADPGGQSLLEALSDDPRKKRAYLVILVIRKSPPTYRLLRMLSMSQPLLACKYKAVILKS